VRKFEGDCQIEISLIILVGAVESRDLQSRSPIAGRDNPLSR
jgi:hypothetical protein